MFAGIPNSDLTSRIKFSFVLCRSATSGKNEMIMVLSYSLEPNKEQLPWNVLVILLHYTPEVK